MKSFKPIMGNILKYLCIVTTILWKGIEVKSENALPKITLNNLEFSQPQNEQKIVGWEYVNNRTGILSREKHEISIGCSANYPIKWDVTGHLVPQNSLLIQPYRRRELINDNNETVTEYSIKIIIFFLDGRNLSESSSRIFCQNPKNPALQASVDIFVPGTNRFVNTGKFERLDQSSTLIPCPTSDPTIPVQLYINYPNETREEILNTTYDPVLGFTLSHSVDHVRAQFICTSGNQSVHVASDFESAIGSFDIESIPPKVKAIKGFKGDTLKLTCFSKDKTVQFKIEEENINGYLTYKTTKVLDNYIQIEFTGNSSGIIKCFSTEETAKTEYILWNFQFIDAPEIYIDNYAGQIHCISEDKDRSIATVECIHPSHCNFMKQCFQNRTSCNFKKQKHFVSDLNSYCWLNKEKRGAHCSSLSFYYLNGLAECSVQGLKRNWEFFLTLEYHRSTNWQDAQTSELIRMNPVDPIISPNETITIFCEAVAFLFANNLKFSIEYANSTVEFLNDSLVTIPGKDDYRKIQHLNVLGEIKIQVPRDAVAIKCHAPWWNSTEFLTTERRFKVIDKISSLN